MTNITKIYVFASLDVLDGTTSSYWVANDQLVPVYPQNNILLTECLRRSLPGSADIMIDVIAVELACIRLTHLFTTSLVRGSSLVLNAMSRPRKWPLSFDFLWFYFIIVSNINISLITV